MASKDSASLAEQASETTGGGYERTTALADFLTRAAACLPRSRDEQTREIRAGNQPSAADPSVD